MRVFSDSPLPETCEETDDISTEFHSDSTHNSSAFDRSTGCNLCSPPNKHLHDASSTSSDGEFHPPANSVITSFSEFYSYSHSDHHIAPHIIFLQENLPQALPLRSIQNIVHSEYKPLMRVNLDLIN